MFRILYDYQAFVMQKYGGISRYFTNLYTHINQQEDISCKIGLFYSQNHYFSQNSRKIFFLEKEKRLRKWNRIYSKYLIEKNDFDVFHPTYYDPYFLQYIKKPFVLTVHDMIHELFPEYFQSNDSTSYNKRLLIEKASHLIAISESTKKDLQNLYSVPDHKVTVIHHGIDVNNQYLIQGNELNEKKYILYVGDRAAYKNFYRFISAASRVIKKDSNVHIICAGGGSFSISEKEFLIQKGVLSNVTQINASDEQLANLFANALVFVYPSLYEGFGLPLLEAFKYNCPVVASNTSCFKEVGGDAVIYFNPYNAEEISNAIEIVINNPETAKACRTLGVQRLEEFTLEKCLKKTTEVYKSL